MAAEFARVGLGYEIWPAVDAEVLTEEQRAFADQERRHRAGLHPISAGSLANTLTHYAVMEDLVNNGPEVMAVFEDDARFDSALPRVLVALKLKQGSFDIVKLQRRNLRRPFVPTFRLDQEHRIGRVRFSDYGSEGFVITREAARHLLERSPRMFRDFDHALSYFWENGLNVFYVDPPVVWEDEAVDSQIEETRSEERLAHRRVRRRHPLVLARHLASTIHRDFRRRIAFRRICRTDRTESVSETTRFVLPGASRPHAADPLNDRPARSPDDAA